MIIFGQNIPLVEALFISLVIIICILIANVVYLVMMMGDLKKLKRTLITEKTDLDRLERDINYYEANKYKSKESKQAVMRNYIHAAFKKGFNRHEIQNALIKKGWPKKEVLEELDKAVNNLKKIYEK